MNYYNRVILPKAINYVCGMYPTMTQRTKIVPEAKGTVLEIGIGSGLNLSLYNPSTVDKIIGIDPSSEIIKMAKKKTKEISIPVELTNHSGEEIQLKNNSIDTIVMTYTLCTIEKPDKALREMKRVLKPKGRLLFCEHGISPEVKIRTIQNLINPLWNCFSGGCQLNRNIPELIEQSGFNIPNLMSGYIKGWKAVSFNYWGYATAK